MLTREHAEHHLDTVLSVVHAIDELVGDKLLPAEIALAGVKAALESLDGDKIAHAVPADIRDIPKRLREDRKAHDAIEAKKLHDKFDVPGGDGG